MEQAAETKTGKKRGHRKVRSGVVLSNKMDKTVVVRIERIKMHPRYKKYIRVWKKVKAHDKENACREGDEGINRCRGILAPFGDQHDFQAEGRKGRETAQKSYGKEQACSFVMAAVAGQPSHEQAHGKAAQHIHGQRRPGEGACLDRAQHMDEESAGHETQPCTGAAGPEREIPADLPPPRRASAKSATSKKAPAKSASNAKFLCHFQFIIADLLHLHGQDQRLRTGFLLHPRVVQKQRSYRLSLAQGPNL